MTVVQDLSGNGRNGTFSPPAITWGGEGLVFTSEGLSFTTGSLSLSSAITLEAWFTPLFASRSLSLASGLVTLTLTDGRYWQFTFSGGGTYRCSKPIEAGSRHYAAVSHTFGSGSGTFIAIDGIQAPGSWVSGTGNEAASTPSGSVSVSLGRGDTFHQLKISDVAKTFSSISAYFAGRA